LFCLYKEVIVISLNYTVFQITVCLLLHRFGTSTSWEGNRMVWHCTGHASQIIVVPVLPPTGSRP